MTKVSKVALAVILAGTLTAGCGSTPRPTRARSTPPRSTRRGNGSKQTMSPWTPTPATATT